MNGIRARLCLYSEGDQSVGHTEPRTCRAEWILETALLLPIAYFVLGQLGNVVACIGRDNMCWIHVTVPR